MISAVGGSRVIFLGFGFHFGELHDTAQRPILRLRPLFLSLSVQLSIGCGDPESSVPAWPNGSGSHGWFTFNVWPNNQCGKWQSWTTRFAITNFGGQFPMIRPQSVLATKTGTLRVLVLVLLEYIISKYQRIKSMSRKYKAVRQPIVEDLVRKPNPPEEMDNNKFRCKSYRNIRSQKSDFTSHRRGSEKAGGHWWNSRPWVTVPMGPSELNGVYRFIRRKSVTSYLAFAQQECQDGAPQSGSKCSGMRRTAIFFCCTSDTNKSETYLGLVDFGDGSFGILWPGFSPLQFVSVFLTISIVLFDLR